MRRSRRSHVVEHSLGRTLAVAGLLPAGLLVAAVVSPALAAGLLAVGAAAGVARLPGGLSRPRSSRSRETHCSSAGVGPGC